MATFVILFFITVVIFILILTGYYYVPGTYRKRSALDKRNKFQGFYTELDNELQLVQRHLDYLHDKIADTDYQPLQVQYDAIVRDRRQLIDGAVNLVKDTALTWRTSGDEANRVRETYTNTTPYCTTLLEKTAPLATQLEKLTDKIEHVQRAVAQANHTFDETEAAYDDITQQGLKADDIKHSLDEAATSLHQARELLRDRKFDEAQANALRVSDYCQTVRSLLKQLVNRYKSAQVVVAELVTMLAALEDKQLPQAEQFLVQIRAQFIAPTVANAEKELADVKNAIGQAKAQVVEVQSQASMDKQDWQGAVTAAVPVKAILEECGKRLIAIQTIGAELNRLYAQCRKDFKTLTTSVEKLWAFVLSYIYNMPTQLLDQLAAIEDVLTLCETKGQVQPIDLGFIVQSVQKATQDLQDLQNNAIYQNKYLTALIEQANKSLHSAQVAVRLYTGGSRDYIPDIVDKAVGQLKIKKVQRILQQAEAATDPQQRLSFSQDVLNLVNDKRKSPVS